MSQNRIFKGDPAGENPLYVWAEDNHLFDAKSLPEILNQMRKKGVTPQIDQESVVFLLHNSLIPAPRTIYKNVYALGIGDQLKVKKSGETEFSCDFPYYQNKSTGESEASTKTLIELLCASVEKRLGADNGALMMSSGKDSVSIALAIKEAGLENNVQAYTYGDPESGYTDEADEAAKISKKLGLKHKMISVPQDPETVKKALLNFFENTSMPSCDPTTIPYITGLYQEGLKKNKILDGTRNDIYFGIVPNASYDALSQYYKLMEAGISCVSTQIEKTLPYYAKTNKFFSSFPEVHLYKHGHLRRSETSQFFDQNADTRAFWTSVYEEQSKYGLDDARTFVIGQYFDGCSVVHKGRMVAEATESSSVLPWADKALTEYCFNLPLEFKFERKSRTNKILLRQMLKEYLEYDAQSIGKRIFYFNMKRFVLENKKLIEDEILACKLWNNGIEVSLKHYLKLCERHDRAAGAVLDLFMISGWHNHSKYLRRTS